LVGAYVRFLDEQNRFNAGIVSCKFTSWNCVIFKNNCVIRMTVVRRVVVTGRLLTDVPCEVCADHSSGKHYGIYACDGFVYAASVQCVIQYISHVLQCSVKVKPKKNPRLQSMNQSKLIYIVSCVASQSEAPWCVGKMLMNTFIRKKRKLPSFVTSSL